MSNMRVVATASDANDLWSALLRLSRVSRVSVASSGLAPGAIDSGAGAMICRRGSVAIECIIDSETWLISLDSAVTTQFAVERNGAVDVRMTIRYDGTKVRHYFAPAAR